MVFFNSGIFYFHSLGKWSSLTFLKLVLNYRLSDQKKHANLSRFTQILPNISRFYPYFWGTPRKKTSWIPPKDVVTDLLQLQPQRRKNTGRDGTSSQVVSALCFCMDLRPVKSHPTLGGELVGWGEFRIAVGSRQIRWLGRFFCCLGATKMGELPKKNRKGW